MAVHGENRVRDAERWRDEKTWNGLEERSKEKIYLEEAWRESCSLPATGMTHLVPADRRMDAEKEGGRRWTGRQAAGGHQRRRQKIVRLRREHIG